MKGCECAWWSWRERNRALDIAALAPSCKIEVCPKRSAIRVALILLTN